VLIGIPPEKIVNFICGSVGRDVTYLSHGAAAGWPTVDIASGATVTVTVIAESMVRSALRVARTLGVGDPAAQPDTSARVMQINAAHEAAPDWAGLVNDGTVKRLSRTVGEVIEAFRRVGNAQGADHPQSDVPNASLIDLYLAPVSISAMGKRLFGGAGFSFSRKL
jgi:NosR/NirI family nitrous oxide reductase transcriptional regulator